VQRGARGEATDGVRGERTARYALAMLMMPVDYIMLLSARLMPRSEPAGKARYVIRDMHDVISRCGYSTLRRVPTLMFHAAVM